MKIAALDLGTNSFLCLIAEGDAQQGITKVHKDMMQVVRLGQGVGETGMFHPDALGRAKACLQEFALEIKKHNVDKVLAMATSAARDAKNGHELFKIGEELNIPIKIIPGSDEARITYQGATVGLSDNTKTSVVIDVGGGSTEFIQGIGNKILFGKSLDIGGVRLTEKLISQQPVSMIEQNRLQEFIKDQIQTVISEIQKTKVDQIIAVAGTPTAIAAIELGGFDEKKIDGFFLSKEKLATWVQEFASTSIQYKKDKYNLGGRADIIYVGASILLNAMEALSLSGMFISTKGVRYGVALEMLRNPGL